MGETRRSRPRATAAGGFGYLRDGRAPIPRDPRVSEVMRANRARNTSPELALRRALTSAGIRGYRLHRPDLVGRPDLAFGRQRVAVFVNGCFWHGCPTCNLPAPRTHSDFWNPESCKEQGA